MSLIDAVCNEWWGDLRVTPDEIAESQLQADAVLAHIRAAFPGGAWWSSGGGAGGGGAGEQIFLGPIEEESEMEVGDEGGEANVGVDDVEEESSQGV